MNSIFLDHSSVRQEWPESFVMFIGRHLSLGSHHETELPYYARGKIRWSLELRLFANDRRPMLFLLRSCYCLVTVQQMRSIASRWRDFLCAQLEKHEILHFFGVESSILVRYHTITRTPVLQIHRATRNAFSTSPVMRRCLSLFLLGSQQIVIWDQRNETVSCHFAHSMCLL